MAYEEQNKATLAETQAKEKLLQDAKKILEKEQVCKLLYIIKNKIYIFSYILGYNKLSFLSLHSLTNEVQVEIHASMRKVDISLIS